MNDQNRGRNRANKKELRRKQKRRLLLCAALVASFGVFVGYLWGKSTGRASQAHYVSATMNESELQYPEFTQIHTEKDGEDRRKEDCILVNKDNPLPDHYVVNLKTLPDGSNRAAEEAYGPLCEMLAAGRKEGLAFEICSSYRDVERQKELFEEDVAALTAQGYSYETAYSKVAEQTMPPGCSEHSTGLAFDIVALDYQMLDEEQEQTAENIWLREHCAEYGFILRYPKDKEDVTKISYESWHFRYVGVEAAEYIMENGLVLEEYLENQA